MQKTALYLFFLLLFGGGVYYFIFNKKDAAFPEEEAGFQIKDTAAVGTIFLSMPNNDRILLNRTDSGWMLNKQYRPLASTLNTLLTTLRQQHTVYPTPESAHNRIITQLAGSGIKVEIYDRKGEKMKVFYVGNEVHNYEGTSMLMEGADKSYVVKVGSSTGLVRSRYSTDMINWRDRTIMNFKEDDIKTVSVTYPTAPLNSFVVTNNQGKITVTADPGVIGTQSLNERRIKMFLGFFENINCEGYLNGEVGLDSVIGTCPKKCVIDITTNKGSRQHLDIYWMPQNRRSKNANITGNMEVPEGYDADRFYAVGNNYKDTMLIQDYAFDKIFRKAYEFYQADPTVDVVGWEDKK